MISQPPWVPTCVGSADLELSSRKARERLSGNRMAGHPRLGPGSPLRSGWDDNSSLAFQPHPVVPGLTRDLPRWLELLMARGPGSSPGPRKFLRRSSSKSASPEPIEPHPERSRRTRWASGSHNPLADTCAGRCPWTIDCQPDRSFQSLGPCLRRDWRTPGSAALASPAPDP